MSQFVPDPLAAFKTHELLLPLKCVLKGFKSADFFFFYRQLKSIVKTDNNYVQDLWNKELERSVLTNQWLRDFKSNHCFVLKMEL